MPGAWSATAETTAARGRRERILELLRAEGEPLGIAALADQLRVHPNTVRFHLETLQQAGQVEQVLGESAGRGRPPVLFRATHRMDPDGPTNYRLLAGMLTEHLAATSPDPVSTAVSIGRGWGAHLVGAGTAPRRASGRGHAVAEMIAVLDQLGFRPEQPTGPRDPTVRLRHCPFLDLVAESESRRVVCSLHLGLMQGALDAAAGPVTVDRLDSFVQPDLCVARLAPVR